MGCVDSIWGSPNTLSNWCPPLGIAGGGGGGVFNLKWQNYIEIIIVFICFHGLLMIKRKREGLEYEVMIYVVCVLFCSLQFLLGSNRIKLYRKSTKNGKWFKFQKICFCPLSAIIIFTCLILKQIESWPCDDAGRIWPHQVSREPSLAIHSGGSPSCQSATPVHSSCDHDLGCTNRPNRHTGWGKYGFSLRVDLVRRVWR